MADLLGIACYKREIFTRTGRQDDSAYFELVTLNRFDGEQCVVDRAKTSSRNNQNWKAAGPSKVRGVPRSGDRHPPAASRLDEHTSDPLMSYRDLGSDPVQVDLDLFRLRGNPRRCWLEKSIRSTCNIVGSLGEGNLVLTRPT